MRIPSDSGERQKLYAELVRQCSKSRRDRFETNRILRNYYLFGTADTSGAIYNRIDATVDTLSSFIYGPESTRFSIHLGTTASDDEIDKVPLLSSEINDQWRTSKTHLLFGLGLDWSLVFGCMLFKCLWNERAKHVQTFLVEPHQFGVLREDVINLEDQEAFCHYYTTTRTQLESELEGNPRKADILSAAGRGTDQENVSSLGSGMDRLILSAGIASSPGSTTTGGSTEDGLAGQGKANYDYVPEEPEDLIDMIELYVWNDEISDYQMVTMASPAVVIYDRKNVGVEGIASFVKLAPDPRCYDYFFGSSFVAKLTQLQDWRTEDIQNIRDLLGKNIDPPISFTGVVGIAEEKLLALRNRGGQAQLGMTGKAEAMRPQIPAEAFKVMDMIDAMYDDMAGIQHVMQGKGASGVRSKGQADLLARLGSSRPKKRSMTVEEAASDLATLILRNVQDHSTQRYQIKSSGLLGRLKKPLTFLAEQFTKDYEVVVDAHSSSPVFMEDRKNDAMTLFEAGAIDRETLLELFDPPSLQVLREKLKLLDAERAKQAQAEALAQGAKK